MRTTTDTYSNLLYRTNLGTSNNNCYAYAIDHYVNKGDRKLQPGDLAGMHGPIDTRSCKDITKRAQADAQKMGWTLTKVSANTTCQEGIKIAAVVAPGEDFHWYRFHKNVLYRVKRPRSIQSLAAEFGVSVANIEGPRRHSTVYVGDTVLIRNANVWSHKQGFSPDGPLLHDASGNIIKDPATADRKYGDGLDYRVFCTYFCLDKKVGKTVPRKKEEQEDGNAGMTDSMHSMMDWGFL